jgi:hypothetical protein
VFGPAAVRAHPRFQVSFDVSPPAQPMITVEKPMSKTAGIAPPLVIVRAARESAGSSGL